jgi:SAM-dependent methyltransferase
MEAMAGFVQPHPASIHGCMTMFSKSARWYDALYAFKDYSQEADQLIRFLEQERQSRHEPGASPAVATLLDVACGTAEHDRYLAGRYQVDGLDINPDFVEIAVQKNPHGQYFVADMTAFSLGRTYDIILCLFSSIGYVKTLENVVNALVCFKAHLNPGGILLVEPWFTPQAWKPYASVHLLTAETAEGKVCRMNVSGQEGLLSIIDFHYLVGTPEGVTHFTERHELGLFTMDEMLGAFLQAGLAVRYDPEGLTGRGLYIARYR